MPQPVLSSQPGWYRGELHCHTIHSDGSWTVAEMWERGRELGLDFIVLTDHNTISEWREVPPYALPRPLLIPGMEITSFHGHALCLGVDRWVDWRIGLNGRSVDDCITETHAARGLFAIAHPFTIGDPRCTGCSWSYPIPGQGTDALEVWNGKWRDPETDNAMALALWRRLLTPAGGPTAIAGSDAHSAAFWNSGAPFAWVYAHELSASAVLNAIKSARVMVSSGPWLELSACLGDGQPWAIAGSHLAGKSIIVRASWRDAPDGARVLLLRERQPTRMGTGGRAGSIALPEDVQESTWYTAEMWSAGGDLLALTNPIFVRPAHANG